MCRLSKFAVLCSVACLLAGRVDASTTQTVGPFQVTFFNNSESGGTYTGGKDWSAPEISDVVASLNTWDFWISDTESRKIELDLYWFEFGTSGPSAGTLGNSQSMVWFSGSSAFTGAEGVWRDGFALSAPPEFDTVIRFDITSGGAGGGWNTGSGAPGGTQVDFRSVVTHEVGHALGFWSMYNSSTDKFNLVNSSPPPSTYDAISTWDSFLEDPSGNVPQAGTVGTPGNFDEAPSPADGVTWTGALGNAANGGSPIPIESPSTYAPGSSLSHVAEATFGETALMSPVLLSGSAVRAPSATELAMMEDMGWTIIPEPRTTVLAALLLTGFVVFRRRQRRDARG